MNTATFSIPKRAFSTIVKQLGSVKPDKTSYPEVCLEATGRDARLTFAATDSVRLVVVDHELGTILESFKECVAFHELSAAVKALPGPDITLVLNRDAGQLVLAGSSGGCAVLATSTRSFPNYRMILPKNQSRRVRGLDRKQMLEALKCLAPEKGKRLDKNAKRFAERVTVEVDPEGGALILAPEKMRTCAFRGEDGPEYRAELVAPRIDGEPLRVIFNGSLLRDFLAAVDCKRVDYSVSKSTYPAELTSPELPGVRYVVMPITN